MEEIYRYVLPHLPPDLQAIILNPPSLSSPSSWFPLVRTIAPWTKWLIVLLAAYIVWSTVASLFGYFSRFLRFSMRIGPIIALIGWIMAASGQGSLSDVMQAVKEYAGLAAPGTGGGQGVPGLASLFGGDPVSSRTRGRNARGKKGSAAQGSTGQAGQAGQAAGDFINSMLGQNGNARGDGWEDVVGDYVKRAVAKASGLDWLFNNQDQQDDRRGRTR